MAKISMTLGQFLAMGEAQGKLLMQGGYSVEIVADSALTAKAVAPTSTISVSKPQATVAKANGKKPVPAKADKKPAVTYGNIKVNDLFKVVNTSTNKPTAVGKAKEINKADNIVIALNGEKFMLDHCLKITEKTYNKLAKKLKPAKAKSVRVSTDKHLCPQDYKIVYCVYLHKNGKINDSELAKAKDNAEYRSELYKQFKDDVKLDNETALKLFAENSAKASA